MREMQGGLSLSPQGVGSTGRLVSAGDELSSAITLSQGISRPGTPAAEYHAQSSFLLPCGQTMNGMLRTSPIFVSIDHLCDLLFDGMIIKVGVNLDARLWSRPSR